MLSLLLVSCLLFAFSGSSVFSLELRSVDEGACQPVQTVQSLNQTWLAGVNWWYLGTGSKYNLYRIASHHPSFPVMRESEFINKACLQGYWNLTTGQSRLYGLGGGTVIDWNVRPTDDPFTFDFVPTHNPADILRHRITLSDNKSFIFFSNCWQSNNKRSWGVVSTTPTLGVEARNMIERHALSMGFNRKHFISLRYENCGRPNPTTRPNRHGRPGVNFPGGRRESWGHGGGGWN